MSYQTMKVKKRLVSASGLVAVAEHRREWLKRTAVRHEGRIARRFMHTWA
jgi:hypothetical protein